MKRSIFAACALAALAAAARVVTLDCPEDGRICIPDAGRVVAVQAFSPVETAGTLTVSSVYAGVVYTNAQRVAASTSTVYRVCYSNELTHALYTNAVARLPPPNDIYAQIVGIDTNQTVSVATNVVSAWSHSVAVTNEIVSATASGHVLTASPEGSFYLGAFDLVVVTGNAASGGWIRLILE